MNHPLPYSEDGVMVMRCVRCRRSSHLCNRDYHFRRQLDTTFASSLTMAANPPPPQTWPKECVDLYSPVRIIGKGGFGNVYMATAKRKESSSSGDSYVAIKVVGNDSYSQREVAILSELSQTPHCNIVRLIDDFQENDGSGHHIIVMSLHRGPTLKYIIEKRGALGMKIGQVISKQLVDAIAYLHGHELLGEK